MLRTHTGAATSSTASVTFPIFILVERLCVVVGPRVLRDLRLRRDELSTDRVPAFMKASCSVHGIFSAIVRGLVYQQAEVHTVRWEGLDTTQQIFDVRRTCIMLPEQNKQVAVRAVCSVHGSRVTNACSSQGQRFSELKVTRPSSYSTPCFRA